MKLTAVHAILAVIIVAGAGVGGYALMTDNQDQAGSGDGGTTPEIDPTALRWNAEVVWQDGEQYYYLAYYCPEAMSGAVTSFMVDGWEVLFFRLAEGQNYVSDRTHPYSFGGPCEVSLYTVSQAGETIRDTSMAVRPTA